VVTQAVEYRHGDAVLEGYLAYDDAVEGKRPGILVVHEWKGLNDYAKSRAGQLAAMGYTAFAADMYGKGILAKDHAEAGKLAGVYLNDRNLMRERARAAYEVLKQNEQVDPSRIAAIGYCFGGATVLEMARAGMGLRGVASFHGALKTPSPAGPGGVRARVLVFNGAEDTFISPEDIAAFKKEMTESGADWNFVEMEGAVHSFTVPSAGSDKSTGVAYHPEADRKSWAMLEDFLKEIFSAGTPEPSV
jgi:dienelactone hydrolase